MINKKVPTIDEVNALISASTPNVSIKTLNTNNASSLDTSSNEAIGGSGSINLHKVSKTGNFSDLNNRGEAFITWGGKNFSGSYGAIDACMVPELGANRFAYIPASAWKVEYSRDSGATWTDYGASDAQKLQLTSSGTGFVIGKADSSHKATSAYMLRITLTTTGAVYTVLNKFFLYVSTNGSSGSYVTIEGRTKANVDANKDTWVGFASKVPISGWSGWNVINTSGVTTHGNQAGHYAQLRFIFGCTSGSTTYNGLQIQKLFGYGGFGWTTPSNLAKYGTIYSTDYNQNAFFPKDLYVQSGTTNNYKVLVTGKTNTFVGTSAFNSGKIYLGQGDNNAIDLGSDGRINSGNSTFVGFIGGLFTIGHTSHNTNIRGKATRPTYNNKDLALVSDIPDISGKADKSEIPTNVVKYASNSANVAGAKKTVSKVNPTTLYVENGLIMGGTAAAAGLVTRGICGVTTPDGNGSCQKENLYLNYDGDNNYSRKVVLGAGGSGDAIDGNEKYGNMLSAVRGDQMKAYVSKQIATAIEIAQGKTTTYVIDPTYTTSGNNKEFNISKTNKTDTLLLTGETKIAPNSDVGNLVSIKDKFRVGDIVLTTGKGVKDWFYAGTKVVNGITCYEFRQIDSDTPDLSGYALQSSLSKVATSGNYNDLSNKPTIPTKVSQLTNDSNFATTTQLGNKQDKNIVLDTLGSTTVEGALKSIKDTADIAISTATNAKETADNCNTRLGTAESTLTSVKANQDFILQGGKEVDINRDLTDSLVLTSTELNNIKDNVLNNPFFTARFKANNLYYKVVFHRKSWFNTSSSAPIYLFEGMYASTSAIFKVYLVFEWGSSFTQKAIKVEKYASIA